MPSNFIFFRDLAYDLLAAGPGGASAWLTRQPLRIGYVLGILVLMGLGFGAVRLPGWTPIPSFIVEMIVSTASALVLVRRAPAWLRRQERKEHTPCLLISANAPLLLCAGSIARAVERGCTSDL